MFILVIECDMIWEITVQFKEREKQSWTSVAFSKVAGFSLRSPFFIEVYFN